MLVDSAVVTWDYVISIVISFAVTATFMILYERKRSPLTETVNVNDNMIEAIVSEYSHRIKYIEKMIVELRVQIDNLELREAYKYNPQTVEKKTSDAMPEFHIPRNTSRHESQAHRDGHITTTSDEHANLAIQPSSSLGPKSSIQDVHNGTMDYVLKLLSERSRTSREIQHSIGRTREHTSRLMKRLYESRLVDRQSKSGPYQYTITEAGRVKLSLQSSGDNAIENASDAVVNFRTSPQYNEEYQR
jgi:predicted transcriptional regulator